MASLSCIVAGTLHSFGLLLAGRFIMAIGSSVGLNMSFTLVSDCHNTTDGKKLIAYLMTAFAITPGPGVALGGLLSEHLGWESCFYAPALYGLALLALTYRTAETAAVIDRNALAPSCILKSYGQTLRNIPLVSGGLLSAMMSFLNMGGTTISVLTISAIATSSVLLLPISYCSFGLIGFIFLTVLYSSHLKA